MPDGLGWATTNSDTLFAALTEAGRCYQLLTQLWDLLFDHDR